MSKKSRFVLDRFGARFLFVNDTIALGSMLFVGERNSFLITFFSIRITFYAISWVFSKIRHRPDFYVAGFQEMDVSSYWMLVSLVMFAMKALFLKGFITLNPFFQYIDFTIATFFIVTALGSFHGKEWASEIQKDRLDRLEKLKRKAKLSNEELDIIAPMLVKNVEKSQKIPMAWKIMRVLIALILGSTLSAYASAIVDQLQRIGVPFQNIFPPY